MTNSIERGIKKLKELASSRRSMNKYNSLHSMRLKFSDALQILEAMKEPEKEPLPTIHDLRGIAEDKPDLKLEMICLAVYNLTISELTKTMGSISFLKSAPPHISKSFTEIFKEAKEQAKEKVVE